MERPMLQDWGPSKLTRVSGVTIVRNAIKYDYPVVESIRSILPLVDEFIVAVGQSDDETVNIINDIRSPKIKIINTIWDESLREGGAVLADETNKALDAVSDESIWVIYLQADEVIHEDFHWRMRIEMQKWKDDFRVEGFLFNYLHFYGSYDYVADSRKWYRKEVRIIRNDKKIRSYKDAQGFRKDGNPLQVRQIEAWVYHYGWVKPPEFIRAKLNFFHTLWHDEEWMKKNIPSIDSFDYSGIDSLERFEGTHPVVMRHRIARQNWKFSFDPTKKRFSLINRILHRIEKKTGYRVGEYKNYKLIKSII
jgi:glycosyltransferase involved in cell wall biosynthesis